MVFIPAGFVAPAVPEIHALERELDQAVLDTLPPESKVLSIAVHGASYWALSHKVEIKLPDGSNQAYFLKVMIGALGQKMALGEYEGVKALHSIIPHNVPQAVGYGTYIQDPGRHFFISSFHDMEMVMPSPSDFVSVLAQLHSKSISPTGKFGFHVTTYGGSHPLQNAWCDSWEELFSRQFKEEVAWEREIQGQNEELERLEEEMVEKVIPRLLRPLQTGGRAIKPSLVHGDCWHGNVGVEIGTGETMLYDPCAIYAHCEYEMTQWRAQRYRTGKQHREEYCKLVGISEPVEDFEDRNALYALRGDIAVSALWPENKKTRIAAQEEMKRLVAKYPDGIEGFKG